MNITCKLNIYLLTKVDIELNGPYCPKGNRVTHKKLLNRPDIEYLDKEECALCSKEISIPYLNILYLSK